MGPYAHYQYMGISIHALRGEGDVADGTKIDAMAISIHALRGEGDTNLLTLFVITNHFNPRPPWGGRRQTQIITTNKTVNFNPRPPWGGRQFSLTVSKKPSYFNPRPPWGGRRQIGG